LQVEEGDRKKVVQAVRAVANHRNELQLHVIANDLEGDNANSDLKLAEAYKRLQIEDFDASEESVLTYYLSLSQNAPPGSKASYDEALRVIAKGRNSSYLMTKLNDPNAVIAPQRGTADQPVGLDNIGNTCYLNSLLQYYYTVKAVRDVVMKFEDYRMPLNTESMLKKRVGGRAVVPGEIMKAQRCK
jgi:ubiquitin carboxyl-terminal hydrolase 25/28